MTACALLIAAIWPSKSAFCSFCSVMSVAYFTTLKGLPLRVEDRIVAGLNPDLLAALADALVLAGVEFAAAELVPEQPVFGALPIGRIDEHAMMLALDLVQRVAQGLQEILVGVLNLAVQLNSITACALLIASSMPEFMRSVVTSRHSRTLPT